MGLNVCFFLEKISSCHKLPSQTLLMGFLSYRQWPCCTSSCSFLLIPLACLSRGSLFISENHTNILSISIFDVYSPSSLAVNLLMTTDTNWKTVEQIEQGHIFNTHILLFIYYWWFIIYWFLNISVGPGWLEKWLYYQVQFCFKSVANWNKYWASKALMQFKALRTQMFSHHKLKLNCHRLNCQSDKQNDTADMSWSDISSVSCVVPASDTASACVTLILLMGLQRPPALPQWKSQISYWQQETDNTQCFKSWKMVFFC